MYYKKNQILFKAEFLLNFTRVNGNCVQTKKLSKFIIKTALIFFKIILESFFFNSCTFTLQASQIENS